MTPAQMIRAARLKLEVSQGVFAKALGVSRVTANELENDKRGITPDMALKLERVTDTDARTWLQAQLEHDLAKARAGIT